LLIESDHRPHPGNRLASTFSARLVARILSITYCVVQIIKQAPPQEQLHKSPSILPVEELDDSFAPLLSLGREIESIDNLFISPNGRITIVETKLFRNPEATRQVLAQILDYAKRLSSLRYEEFEKKCSSASPQCHWLRQAYTT